MARIEHRKILLRFYDDTPQHQEILRWIDGYSGRGLQNILNEALLIGLPQFLGSSLPVADSVSNKKSSIHRVVPDKSLSRPDFVAAKPLPDVGKPLPDVEKPLQDAKPGNLTKEQVPVEITENEEDELQAQRDEIRRALQKVMGDN